MRRACTRATALCALLTVLAAGVSPARAGTHSAMSSSFMADSWDWHVQSVGYALEEGDRLKVSAVVTNQTGVAQTRWFGASVVGDFVWYDDPGNDEQWTIPRAGSLSVARFFRLSQARNHGTGASVPAGTPLDVYIRFWTNKTSEVDYLMTGPVSRLAEGASPITWDGAGSLAEGVYYELWRATTPDLADALPVNVNANGRTAAAAGAVLLLGARGQGDQAACG